MEMRVDDEVDLARISVNRVEAGADLLAGSKADTKQPSEPQAQPSSGVVLAIGMEPCVKQCPSLWVLDQKDLDRTVMSPSPPSIRWANSPVTAPQVKA